ncbi:MAG: EAL domain-containing protein [Sterolibacterium sp.]
MNTFLSLIESMAAAKRPAMPVLSRSEAMEAVLGRRYGVDFQPVVTPDGSLLAWRAKAQFASANGRRLSPNAVFAALHRDPGLLLFTELDLKCLALAGAPGKSQLLLPLDADSYAAGRDDVDNAFDRLFRGRGNIIVEICENRSATDVQRLRQLLRGLAGQGIPVAIGGRTPASGCVGETFHEVDWLRLPCPQDLRDPRRMRAMESIAEAASLAGAVAFVSGVPDAETLALVRAIGFSGACGPVFDGCGHQVWSAEVELQDLLARRTRIAI